MARTRNLKPSFFTNEQLSDLDPLARLLFQGLWLHADREGRLEDRPRKIKAEILPYDDCDIDQLLDALQAAGFILRYEVQSKRCILLPTFTKHQNPHPKEPASTLPAPASNLKPRSRRENKRLVLPLPIPSSSLMPSSLKTTLPGKPDRSRAVLADEIFMDWAQVMNHPKAIFTPERRRAVEGRLKEGYTVERLKQATRGNKASPRHQGQNERGEVYDDLELICRDGKHVEQFIAMAENPPVAGNGRVEPPEKPIKYANQDEVDRFNAARKEKNSA